MKYVINEEKIKQAFSDWGEGRYRWTTQAEKSKATGLSQSVISRLENQTKKFGELKADQFLTVCAAINRAPHEFMEIEQ